MCIFNDKFILRKTKKYSKLNINVKIKTSDETISDDLFLIFDTIVLEFIYKTECAMLAIMILWKELLRAREFI